MTAGFSMSLHPDLGVAIGRREGFGATGREAISAQDIDFLGVAADEDSEGGVASDSTTGFGDTLSGRSRTTSGEGIERGKSFDDVGDEKIIDRDDEEDDETEEVDDFDSEADETANSTGC